MKELNRTEQNRSKQSDEREQVVVSVQASSTNREGRQFIFQHAEKKQSVEKRRATESRVFLRRFFRLGLFLEGGGSRWRMAEEVKVDGRQSSEVDASSEESYSGRCITNFCDS